MSAQFGASAPGADGIGLLHVPQQAGRTTGPTPRVDGGDPHAPDTRSKRAALVHWSSGFTPEPLTAPAVATDAPQGAGAPPAAVAAADDDDGGAPMRDDDGATAAAHALAPAFRPISIKKHKKAKGAPPPTAEDVRNAAGVGDLPAQLPADAPDAKFAYARASDIARALQSRPRWVADGDAYTPAQTCHNDGRRS